MRYSIPDDRDREHLLACDAGRDGGRLRQAARMRPDVLGRCVPPCAPEHRKSVDLQAVVVQPGELRGSKPCGVRMVERDRRAGDAGKARMVPPRRGPIVRKASRLGPSHPGAPAAPDRPAGGRRIRGARGVASLAKACMDAAWP